MPAGVDLCPRRRVSSRWGRFFAAAVATPASASAHCPQTPGNQRHWGRSRGASRASAPRRRWVDLRRLCPPPTVSASRLRETLGTPRLSGRFGGVYSTSTAHRHLGAVGNGPAAATATSQAEAGPLSTAPSMADVRRARSDRPSGSTTNAHSDSGVQGSPWHTVGFPNGKPDGVGAGLADRAAISSLSPLDLGNFCDMSTAGRLQGRVSW